MSTRATYKINGIYFYIHYDGYPDGAAVYFHNALLYQHKRGGLAAQFIRANDLAEFTESHEVHGDTEFRYDLQGENLTVYSNHWTETDGDCWSCSFSGSVYAFINANQESGRVEEWYKVPDYYPYGKREVWTCNTDLLNQIKQAHTKLGNMIAHASKLDNPNIKNYRAELDHWVSLAKDRELFRGPFYTGEVIAA